MERNSIIRGFRIENIRFSEELNGEVYEMTHLKTGASLVWVDNGLENKVFSISFKTIPCDNTGVFHILEHCVFQGSSKYPSHHLFTELLKGSVHTYLNAATMPDRTTFPVASCNDKDFMNLADVYLSSVLHPMVLSEPHIFEQEGWHYELDEEGELYANGVVYNEMKGLYTSHGYLLMEQLAQALYEGTGYDCSAGGEPSHITELSYEMLKEAHEKHYHPGNSFVYLDGAMDIEAVLGMIDGHFESFDKRAARPFRELIIGEHKEVVCEYAAIDEFEGATLAAGRVLDGYRGAKDSFAFGILMDYLAGSNESVLTKAILSRGIAYEVSAYMDANNNSPHIALILKQLDPERKDEALSVISEVISAVKNRGFDRDNLEACIDQLEYKLKDVEEPTGLMRGEMAVSGWMYGSDVLEMMTFNGLTDYLRECIDNGTYERLLEEIVLDGAGTAEVMLLPSADKLERDLMEEAARFESVRDSMSEEELDEIREAQVALGEWRSAPDSEEVLASIPGIGLSELKLKKQNIETDELIINGRPVLLHTTRTNSLTYVKLYYSVADCCEEELVRLSVMTNIVGMLPTHRHSLAELEKLQRRYLGGFDCNISAYSVRGGREACRPYFEISFMCLPRYEQKAVELVREILMETCYESEESLELIHMILMQCYQSLGDALLEDGSTFAIRRAGSHVYAPAYFGELIEGYEFLKYLKGIIESYDSCFREYAAACSSVADRIFSAPRMTLSINSDRDVEAKRQLAERFLDAFAREDESFDSASEVMRLRLDGTCSKELIQIPGQVGYAASAGYSKELESSFTGGVNALIQIIDFEYLWDRIRTQGGAYGCNSHLSSSGLWGMFSYRDPSPTLSLKVFEETPGFIESYVGELADGGSIDSYIIGAFSAVDPLMDGYTMGRRADDEWFCGITREEQELRKKELLSTQAESLLMYGPMLSEHSFRCIVGSIDLLPEEERESWKLI